MNSVSPSVYVRFASLYARDLCGTMQPQQNITTLAFNPNELSTTVGYQWDTSIIVTPTLGTNGTTMFTQAKWGDQ